VRRSGIGLALGLASATSFGTAGPFASSLISAGWTPGAAVLTRVSIAAAVLAIPAASQLRGQWRLFRRSGPLALAFGVFAVALPQLCYFEAIERIPVGVALMIEYSGTALVVLWMWLRHGQRPGWLTVAGAAVALAGLALVLNLGGVRTVDPVGILWGLGAAVGLAVYFVLSASTRQALPPLAFAWSGLTVGAVTLALLGTAGIVPLTAPRSDVTLAGQHVSWLLPVLGLSLVAAALAYLSGIAAARLLGARLASFVGLVEVLAAVTFAWALLDQVPTLLQAIGGALVIAGVIALRSGETPPVADAAPRERTPIAVR
jgi:drug/metabolite transporter (DMT)-like permease